MQAIEKTEINLLSRFSKYLKRKISRVLSARQRNTDL